MLNILVPTDFSALSKVAVSYAIKIANQLNGNVTLLHVVSLTQTVRASMRGKITLEEDLISLAETELKKLIMEVEYDNETTTPLKWAVASGSNFSKTIEQESKRLRSGLIVIGTHGASGIKKALIGSNATSVIELSSIPVLAVPNKAKFKGFKDIVYASDLKNLDKELKIIMPYLEKFGSTIHVLHIASSGNDVERLETQIDKAVKKLSYKNIVTLVLVDFNIEGAIDQYLGVTQADVLTMFTHDLTFYDKLFDKSITRKMAFYSNVPLLAFKTKRQPKLS
jgi:nucleotide-binding universal stress UspA family protein